MGALWMTGCSLKATISLGAVLMPEDAINRRDLIKKADDAHYAAKQSGRNRVCGSPVKRIFAVEEDARRILRSSL